LSSEVARTGSLCIKGDRRHCLRTVKVTRVTDTKVSTMDFQTWDADCDRSFEMALPPRWEFRDRAFGSPGIWRPFHEAVSSEINTLVRRGQRRGTVSINGADFAVDLHDMVAMPTEQYAVPRMLRKSVRQPNVNKKALKLLYQKYADELPPADHPGGPDGVAGEKFLEFFRDLEVDPGTDVAALALASACNAAEMGIFRRREFICGCAALEVDNIADLRTKMAQLREQVVSGQALADVYTYTFGVALDPPCKVLPLEEAAQYWALLLPNWSLREDFCDWAAKNMKGRAIPRDLWMMVLKLATEVPADLSTYDENPAWPVVLDDFVEYYRAQKGL